MKILNETYREILELLEPVTKNLIGLKPRKHGKVFKFGDFTFTFMNSGSFRSVFSVQYRDVFLPFVVKVNRTKINSNAYEFANFVVGERMFEMSIFAEVYALFHKSILIMEKLHTISKQSKIDQIKNIFEYYFEPLKCETNKRIGKHTDAYDVRSHNVLDDKLIDFAQPMRLQPYMRN